jgi:hypothetical protein
MANMLGMVYLCKLANWIPLGKIPIYANDAWTAYSDMAAQVIVESNCSWLLLLRLDKCAAGNESLIISIPSALI